LIYDSRIGTPTSSLVVNSSAWPWLGRSLVPLVC